MPTGASATEDLEGFGMLCKVSLLGLGVRLSHPFFVYSFSIPSQKPTLTVIAFEVAQMLA